MIKPRMSDDMREAVIADALRMADNPLTIAADCPYAAVSDVFREARRVWLDEYNKRRQRGRK